MATGQEATEIECDFFASEDGHDRGDEPEQANQLDLLSSNRIFGGRLEKNSVLLMAQLTSLSFVFAELLLEDRANGFQTIGRVESYSEITKAHLNHRRL